MIHSGRSGQKRDESNSLIFTSKLSCAYLLTKYELSDSMLNVFSKYFVNLEINAISIFVLVCEMLA